MADNLEDLREFMGLKTMAGGVTHRVEPKLGGTAIPIYVDMRGFITFVAKEV